MAQPMASRRPGGALVHHIQSCNSNPSSAPLCVSFASYLPRLNYAFSLAARTASTSVLFVSRTPRQIRCAAGTSKGFGKRPPPPLPKTSQAPSTPLPVSSPSPEDSAEEEATKRREAEDDAIPEVVTSRILKRLSFTVGAPLLLGLGFFPFFYFLKVVQKVDIPEWLPLICSILLFGAAGLGISYGVISTSWDPEREETLLGWKEAKANWPIFTQTLERKRET